jgi:hypothetical protein
MILQNQIRLRSVRLHNEPRDVSEGGDTHVMRTRTPLLLTVGAENQTLVCV